MINQIWNDSHKEKKETKLDKNMKLWYLRLPNYWPLLPKSHSWSAEWALGSTLTQFWDFSNISYRPVGSFYTKSDIIHTKFRFTCGNSATIIFRISACHPTMCLFYFQLWPYMPQVICYKTYTKIILHFMELLTPIY